MATDSRVVVDTNVILSAVLFPHSVPAAALAAARRAGAVLASVAFLAEVRDVLLRPRFERYLPLADRVAALAAFNAGIELVPITETIHACRDPDDDRVLEVAVCGRATALVTGDDDLLALHPFRGVPVLTPAAFLAAFDPPPPA